MFCVLHEIDSEASSAEASAVILGLSVCEECLEAILFNIIANNLYSAEEYLLDAKMGGWVSSPGAK